MKIIYKLLTGFLIIASLIWLVGYFSIRAGRKALRDSIAQNSISLTEDLLDKMDRGIYYRIEVFQEYARDLILMDAVMKSNREFAKLEDARAYIDEKERDWVSAPVEALTPFMRELLGNSLSKELREKAGYYEENYGYRLIGEVFVTNRYGANIAQTGKTTDYRQDDEGWWQRARSDGLHVGDVAYDESAAVYSIAIAIRINDEEGDFAGVMKVVLNIEEAISVIREFKPSAVHAGPKTIHFQLTTKDGRMIYSTRDFRIFEDASGLLKYFRQPGRRHAPYVIREGCEHGDGEELSVHAHSGGYRDFRGLGWILILDLETEEVFAPVARLAHGMFAFSLAVTLFALLLGAMISRSISASLGKLRDAAKEVGGGNLDAPIEVESSDEIGELASSFRKMTEDLKKTTVSRDYVSNIMQSMMDSLVVLTPDGTIERVNQATLDLLGYEENELLGRPVGMILEEGLQSNGREMAGMKAGSGVNMEKTFLPKGGGNIPVLFSGSVMRDAEGKIQGIVCAARNITERKIAEKEREHLLQETERINKELKDFSYIVSHDLKAPLRGISQLADWIAEDYADKLGDEGKKQLGLLLERTRHMHRLIEDILQYSRVGRINLEPEDVDAGEVVKQVVDSLSLPENIHFTLHEPLPTISINPVQLTQIFQNLIGNAVKFIDKPEGLIEAGCNDLGDFWEFYVRDNGPGFGEEHFERIFQIFQGLHKREDSTGIGLTIVRKTVETNGGKVSVESELEKGSTFSFTLPKKK